VGKKLSMFLEPVRVFTVRNGFLTHVLTAELGLP
jgi:hypothetical protein